MVSADSVRFGIGIVGNVISFFLFLLPLPTFIQIFKKKSVGQFKPDPYIATILNCAMWVLYGLPFIHPHNILVATINGIGLAIELFYVAFFFYYSNGWGLNRKKITFGLVSEALFFVAMLLTALLAVHTTAKRTILIGAVCVVLNIIMYLSPLTLMHIVIQTKSVEYISFLSSLTSLLNGACWTAYALIKFDPWMVIPNGLGTLSGIVQLILYAIYYKKPKKD